MVNGDLVVVNNQWIEGPPPSGSTYGYSIESGTLVELKNGERFLVGDCNTRQGVCDCCTEFYQDQILRYKIVYTKET